MDSDSRQPTESQALHERIFELEQQLQEARQENATLRESDMYWRSLVQAAPVYLSVVDSEARLLFLNRPGDGYRPDEILGRSILDATLPEHRTAMQQALRAVFERGTIENYEACDLNQHRWYSTTVGPLYRDDKVVAAVQCSEDITEKHEMRRHLAAAETRWRTLLENAPDTVVLFTAEGQIRFINRTSAAYTPQEVVGRGGDDFIVERDRPAMHAAIARVFSTGEPQEIEITEKRNHLVYSGRIALIGDLDGEPTAIAFLRNVTSERQRQHELRESEARLRLALHQAPIILWTTDQELQITSSMGAGLEALGLATDQARGMSIYDFVDSPDPNAQTIAAHLAALEGKSVEYSQVWNELMFQTHVEPLRDIHGTIVGVVGISLDVTAWHNTQTQLKQISSELEVRVQQRTEELAALNRQLLADIDIRRIVERELRESEERFRIIAETLPIAVVIVGRTDQQVMYVNQQACDLFGANSGDLYAGQVPLPCSDAALHQECMESLQEGEPVVDREMHSRKADGTPIWISASVVGMQYQGKEAFLCGMLETTDRKRAEEELREEQVLLMRLLEMNEREREVIAYEIHDGFLQDVTASIMFLETAQDSLSHLPERTTEQIHQGLELLRESIKEARRLISNLRPPVLEEAGVVAAVEELIAKIHNLFGLEVELQASMGPWRLAPALEMAVFRIIQEGLTNIHRHSQSVRAKVTIGEHEGKVLLEIRDWGIGFDPAKTPKKRYGLTGMQERASLLGGRTAIVSRPGEGTLIQVELPVVTLSGEHRR